MWRQYDHYLNLQLDKLPPVLRHYRPSSSGTSMLLMAIMVISTNFIMRNPTLTQATSADTHHISMHINTINTFHWLTKMPA